MTDEKYAIARQKKDYIGYLEKRIELIKISFAIKIGSWSITDRPNWQPVKYHIASKAMDEPPVEDNDIEFAGLVYKDTILTILERKLEKAKKEFAEL